MHVCCNWQQYSIDVRYKQGESPSHFADAPCLTTVRCDTIATTVIVQDNDDEVYHSDS